MTRSGGKVKSFSTKIVKADVIGGEEDFCEYSCGYKRTEDGLEKYYSTEPSGFTFIQKVPNWVRYIDKLGICIITSNPGNVYTWDGVTDEKKPIGSVVSKTLGVFTSETEDTGKYYVFGQRRYIAFSPDGTNSRVELRHPFYCGLVNCGRFFARDYNDGLIVRWTGNMVNDFYDGLDHGGWLRVISDGGNIENMLRTPDGIVLLRQYGATLLYALSDPRHFRVGPTTVFDLGAPTSCLASTTLGGKVYFAAGDRLFYLEGTYPKEIKTPKFMRGSVIEKVEPYDQRYLYLNYTQGGDAYLAEYDSVTGTVSPFAKGCRVCWHVKDKFYCFDKDNLIVSLSVGAEGGREWRSRPFKFDGGKLCTLKSVTAELSGNAAVEISAGGVSRSVSASGCTHVGLTGGEFTFAVTGAGSVHRLTAEWEVRE